MNSYIKKLEEYVKISIEEAKRKDPNIADEKLIEKMLDVEAINNLLLVMFNEISEDKITQIPYSFWINSSN